MKKTPAIFWGILLQFISLSSFAQWLSTTTTSVYHHYAVDAVSDDVIYAGGYGGSFFKSIDAGANWTSLGIGSTDWINDIHFEDDLTGWVVSSPGTTDPGNILKTTDGGKTWTSVHNKYQYSSMDWPSSSVGYVGTWDGFIVKTTDGGKNWSVVNVPSSSNLHKLFFVDDSYGFAIGTDYKLYRTANGGISWDVFSHRGIKAVYFHDRSNGFCINDYGEVGRTNDGGATFTYWTSPYPEYKLNDIAFSDAQNGIAIGGLDCANGNCTPKPAIFVTHNGGGSWTNDMQHPHIGQDIGFYAIDFSPNGAAHIAGSDHIMLRNTEFTDVSSINSEEKTNLSIYPNPVSSSLNINATNIKARGQELMLTNAIGQVVRTFTIDNATTTLDVKNLDQGIYFLINKTEGVSYKIIKD